MHYGQVSMMLPVSQVKHKYEVAVMSTQKQVYNHEFSVTTEISKYLH